MVTGGGIQLKSYSSTLLILSEGYSASETVSAGIDEQRGNGLEIEWTNGFPIARYGRLTGKSQSVSESRLLRLLGRNCSFPSVSGDLGHSGVGDHSGRESQSVAGGEGKVIAASLSSNARRGLEYLIKLWKS